MAYYGRDPTLCSFWCHPRFLFMTARAVFVPVPPQERTGVKMVMIQDGPLPTGADKPLRITGDPFKVQVGKKPWIGQVLGVGCHLVVTCRALMSFKKL